MTDSWCLARISAVDLWARRMNVRLLCGLSVLALFFGGYSGVPASLVGHHADQELPVVYRVSGEPRLQIGSADDNSAAFFRIIDAIRLNDGTFLVADGGLQALKFFDSQGVYLRSLGREGDGPGEFRGLYRVAELEDRRIAALDFALARVTIFSTDRGPDHTYPMPRGLDGTETGVQPRGLLGNGSVVGLREIEGVGVETRYGGDSGISLVYRSPVVQPVLVDTLGRVSSFLKPIRGAETLSQVNVSRKATTINVGGQFAPMPFLGEVLVAARGDRIAIGPLGDVFVGTFDADGTMRPSFGGTALPTEAPTDVREAWVDEWVTRFPDAKERREWRDRYEAFLSSGQATAVVPAFTGLAIQSDGKVWWESYDPALGESDPSRWVVVDPSVLELGHSGTVTLPAGFRPSYAGPNYVLGVWKDALDIEYLRVYDLIDVDPGR